ncbi:MAG: DUF4827 family protein [Bacteroidota bacterium]|nr:DUF4827 family protein [Bacteroidota bacterium]
MKRFPLLLVLVAVLTNVLISCDNTKTYAEQLADEKASIQAFIKDRGYKITTTYPDTIPFPDNVFYKTSTGLYIHVIDTGAQIIDTIPTNTVVTVRFNEVSMDGDTTYTNMYGTGDPYELFYGNVQTSVTYGDCKAWHEPLKYVGDGGHVFIIAPSKLGMSMYSSSSSTLTPCFYELRYTFWK